MTKSSVYESVTASLVDMFERGAADPTAWVKPWQAIGARHRSAVGRAYRGINTLILADSAARNAFASPVWGTFKQWKALGAQVMARPVDVEAGEWGTRVVLFKSTGPRKPRPGEDLDAARKPGMFATSFSVFNAAQVIDANKSPAVAALDAGPRNVDSRDAQCDAFIESTAAVIDYGGDSAYYSPAADRIALPAFESFDSGAAFYSVAAHELTHWSGHASRLNRDLANRFGSEQYAAEELIAELGSAFLMARLGVESTPRADHAHYLANWAQLLRGDSRAIFTASSSAQAAADYLLPTVDADSVEGVSVDTAAVTA